MLLKNTAIFVPPQLNSRPPPKDRPITRASSLLYKEGIRCIFGFSFQRENSILYIDGLSCDQNNWVSHKKIAVGAVHDRFPSQLRHAVFSEMLAHILPSPMGNPLSFTLLCRDKIKTQRKLEQEGICMPYLEVNHTLFKARLSEWGHGFIKPQFGALGTGIQKVDKDSTIPQMLPGVDPNSVEPCILQRAIYPPNGFAGMSVRCLIQRLSKHEWIIRPPVLRMSKTDPVVNVARGATAHAAEDHLPQSCMTQIHHTAQRISNVINTLENGHLAVECGIDFVIDRHYVPWVVELNSRPRGRLEHLAHTEHDRFYNIHIECLAQPIRYLANITDD